MNGRDATKSVNEEHLPLANLANGEGPACLLDMNAFACCDSLGGPSARRHLAALSVHFPMVMTTKMTSKCAPYY